MAQSLWKTDSTRKLLELISEYSKVAGYKINTQKSLAFLYANNEKSEREIKESIPFTIATERIKYLGINLPKEMKELYTENYKTLLKEIKDDINWWRDIPYPSVGRINTLKMIILPNEIYKFLSIHDSNNQYPFNSNNVIPIKLSMAFYTELEQKFSHFIWKHERPQIAKAVFFLLLFFEGLFTKQSWERRMELQESSFLTSYYTTKIQSSRQYGTGTKTEI